MKFILTIAVVRGQMKATKDVISRSKEHNGFKLVLDVKEEYILCSEKYYSLFFEPNFEEKTRRNSITVAVKEDYEFDTIELAKDWCNERKIKIEL